MHQWVALKNQLNQPDKIDRWRDLKSIDEIQEKCVSYAIVEYQIDDFYSPERMWLQLPPGCASRSNHFAFVSNPLGMMNMFVRSNRCEHLLWNGYQRGHLFRWLAQFSALNRLTSSSNSVAFIEWEKNGYLSQLKIISTRFFCGQHKNKVS